MRRSLRKRVSGCVRGATTKDIRSGQPILVNYLLQFDLEFPFIAVDIEGVLGADLQISGKGLGVVVDAWRNHTNLEFMFARRDLQLRDLVHLNGAEERMSFCVV